MLCISKRRFNNLKSCHKTVVLNFFCSATRYTDPQNSILSHKIYEPPKRGTSDTSSCSPFLLTHGILGSKRNWKTVATTVSKAINSQVIAFDARNHGDSFYTEVLSYEAMAEDVLRLAKDLNVSKFSLMGHSMGGRVVMTFALKYPELLDKLVVIDMSPFSLGHDIPRMSDCMKTGLGINFDLGRRLPLSEARKMADSALTSVCTDPAVRTFVTKNLAESNGSIYWKPNLPALLEYANRPFAFPEHLLSKTFNSPTLFIKGEISPYIDEADVSKIQKMFPNSKVDTIQNAEHWPYVDNLDGFLASLVPFLKS